MRLLPALVLAALLCVQPGFATARDDVHAASHGDAYAIQQLGVLHSSQDRLARGRVQGNEQEVRLGFHGVIESLVQLRDLFGFAWAQQRLLEVYAEPDCPEMHLGFSEDRRVMLRVETAELFNPVFEDYTILFCNLVSLQDEDVLAQQRGRMLIELMDGTVLEADQLDPQHALWEHVGKTAGTYVSPETVLSGHSSAFRQLYSIGNLSRDSISAVSLDWDGHHFRLEWYENEVAD